MTVNGQHGFTFVCQAEVVGHYLTLSSDRFVFHFGNDKNSMSATEKMVMTNSSLIDVQYWFTLEDPTIVIAPLQGRVPRQSSLSVELTFLPKHAMKPKECEIILHVSKGPIRKLSAHYELAESICVFRGSPVTFGKFSVGVPITKTVVIKNTGESDTMFKYQGELPPNLVLSPTTHYLEVGQAVPIQVTRDAPRTLALLPIPWPFPSLRHTHLSQVPIPHLLPTFLVSEFPLCR